MQQISINNCWRGAPRTGYQSIVAGARAAAAGSIMLRAEVRGSTPTCRASVHESSCSQQVIECCWCGGQVSVDGKMLEVAAQYEAQVGVRGAEVTRRELRRKFILPEDIDVDHVAYNLRPDGVLRVEIFLKDTSHQPHYRCSVTTEDVTGLVKPITD